ncbi:MAG: AraC family transcriptional regulator [Candidatus Ornithospirochaeta sp.]|nr:AraC family transcriptional regulator [Candidatus Ornithospirochaeta sp.]
MEDESYSITFSGRFHYTKGGGVSLHRHSEDYQIQLVYGGSAKARVDYDYYFLKAGDILFLKKGNLHEFRVLSAEGFKTLELKFSNPNPYVESLISDISVLFEDRENQIFNIFSRIVQEGYMKLPDYKLMSTTLLTESLVTMKRICSEKSAVKYNPLIAPVQTKADRNTSRIMQCVTDYVYRNIEKRFSLKDLAEGCGYNQDYIYRMIHRETGLSTIQYVNMIKFEQAKNLIQHTELSLSEISWNLGFESLQYFSKFFRQRASMTPSEYLNKTRNKVRTDY